MFIFNGAIELSCIWNATEKVTTISSQINRTNWFSIVKICCLFIRKWPPAFHHKHVRFICFDLVKLKSWKRNLVQRKQGFSSEIYLILFTMCTMFIKTDETNNFYLISNFLSYICILILSYWVRNIFYIKMLYKLCRHPFLWRLFSVFIYL